MSVTGSSCVRRRRVHLLAVLFIASICTRVRGFIGLSSLPLTPYRRAQASAARPFLRPSSAPRSTVRLDFARTEAISDSPNAHNAVWRRAGAVDVAFPPEFRAPKGVVHFVGGAVVGAFPKSSYGPLIESIAREGYCVVATPMAEGLFDHHRVALEAAALFGNAMEDVRRVYDTEVLSQVPLFGVGHSLGAKAHVLIGCRSNLWAKRRANVLISFNNFSPVKSVPLLKKLRDLAAAFGTVRGPDMYQQVLRSRLCELTTLLPRLEGSGLGVSLPTEWEYMVKSGLARNLYPIEEVAPARGASKIPLVFTPTPKQTWALIENNYAVERNLVIRFDRDTTDQSRHLRHLLSRKFSGQGHTRTSKLPGTHITPNTPQAVLDFAASNTPGPIWGTADKWVPPGADAHALVWLGDTWFLESAMLTETGMLDRGRSGALAASRELRALSTCITDFFNEASEWPVDAAGALPTAQQRTT